MERRRLALIGFGLLLVACADGGGGAVDADDPVELVVHATASSTDAVRELAAAFEAASGVPVLLNLAGSQTLAAQLVAGAPGDVLIAADEVQMDAVARAGLLAGEPVTVATNELAIAVEAGDPRGVSGLADLARPDLIIVLAAEEVPAGRYAREALARAGVDVRPASREQSVRAALAKVTQGEADAAIVYASDIVAAGGRVDGVSIPARYNVVATYPAAVLAGATAPDTAAAFVAFLRSAAGQDVLRAYGFGRP